MLEREVVGLGESRRTESVWIKTSISDAESGDDGFPTQTGPIGPLVALAVITRFLFFRYTRDLSVICDCR